VGLYIGIDGGYSKSKGVLINEDGQILSKFNTCGTAIVGKPSRKSLSTLLDLVTKLCIKADIDKNSIDYYGIGLNGVDYEDEHPVQLQDIGGHFNSSKENIKLVNDSIIALWGSSSNPASAMLQHGSDFTSAYRDNFGNEKIFDSLNIAKSFEIRYEVRAIVARMIDGRLEPTIIKDKILDYFDVPEHLFAEYVHRNKFTLPKLLNVTSTVYDAWLEGDKEVDKLIEKAVSDYILTIKTIIKKIGKKNVDVFLGGGVITKAPREFWAYTSDRFKDTLDISIKKVLLPPEYGAAIMAGYNCGLDPAEYFNKINNNYKENLSN